MLTAFGTVAVSVMLLSYWQEALQVVHAGFAAASAATAAYSALV
jgi:hypothetical protein